MNLNGQCLTFYIQYLGCKGDWPWLRSCYRLETGYKSHRICHRCPAGELCINLRLFFFVGGHCPPKILYIIFWGNGAVKDWYNFSASASIRSWPKDGEVDSPFKTGDKAAIRNIVPGGDDPYMIKIDIAHTYAICGYGKDDLASIIVFLSCRCLLFGGRKIEDQLDNAFQSFNNWCIVNKKTTSITSFDYQTLKITSLLDQCLPLVPQNVQTLGPDMPPVNGRSSSQVAGVSQRTRQGLRHGSTGSLDGSLSGITSGWWGSSILVWDMYFSVVNCPWNSPYHKSHQKTLVFFFALTIDRVPLVCVSTIVGFHHYGLNSVAKKNIP